MVDFINEILNPHKPFDLELIDLNALLGHKVTVSLARNDNESQQFKVLRVSGNKITLDNRKMDVDHSYFNHDNEVKVFFYYKEQRFAVDATYTFSLNKRLLILKNRITPLNRRRFPRFNISSRVEVAILPKRNFSTEEIESFKWFKTDTVDISSGGMMLTIRNFLNSNSYLIVNSNLTEYLIPEILVAQIKYNFRNNDSKSSIGMEFILNEDKQKHFSESFFSTLPEELFKYDKLTRDLVNAKLIARTQ